MEWKENLIKTSVDRLLEYLTEEETASVSQAAEDLDVTEDMVNIWASALEDAGMIERTYSARKGPVLKIADLEKAEEKIEETRQDTAEELEKAAEEVDFEHEEFEEAKETLKQLQDVLEQREKTDEQLEELLEELHDEEEAAEDIDGRMGEHVGELLRSIEEQLATAEELEAEIASFQERRQTIQDNIEAMSQLKQHLDEMKDGEHPCDQCGRSFDTQRGLSVHQTKVHGDEEDDGKGLLRRLLPFA